MGEFLLYLSSALIVLWTVQMARMKRRNPWLWGGTALGLLLLGLNISVLQFLGVLPLLLLFFVRGPQPAPRQTEPAPPESEKPEASAVACPRCHTQHVANRRYCIQCGWELAKPYADPAAPRGDTAQAKPVAPPAESAAGKPPTAEPTPASTPPPEPEAPPKPAYSGPPTPRRLTERGTALFNQGRIQEAIDQFTKALALDADDKEARLRRAEAYARQGRQRAAAEDRRIAGAS